MRLAAKVRCALVPPKPKEERPPLAECGVEQWRGLPGEMLRENWDLTRENRDMMWIQGDLASFTMFGSKVGVQTMVIMDSKHHRLGYGAPMAIFPITRGTAPPSKVTYPP